MSKEILVALSEWGFWGEERVGPFIMPGGTRPHHREIDASSRLDNPLNL
jgi:hypothetical protein